MAIYSLSVLGSKPRGFRLAGSPKHCRSEASSRIDTRQYVLASGIQATAPEPAGRRRRSTATSVVAGTACSPENNAPPLYASTSFASFGVSAAAPSGVAGPGSGGSGDPEKAGDEKERTQRREEKS